MPIGLHPVRPQDHIIDCGSQSFCSWCTSVLCSVSRTRVLSDLSRLAVLLTEPVAVKVRLVMISPRPTA